MAQAWCTSAPERSRISTCADALALELEALGVPAAQIDPGGECTKCDPQGRFYSYRRDNTRTGQLLGVIVRP